MLQIISHTKNSWLPTALTWTLCIVILPTIYYRITNYTFVRYTSSDPWAYTLDTFSFLWLLVEFFATLFLLFGFGGRLMATMVAILLVEIIPMPFEWSFAVIGFSIVGDQWIYLLLSLILVFLGSGKFSVDRFLTAMLWEENKPSTEE